MKIVVINLESQQRRWLEVMTQFVSIGLDVQLLPATPGHSLMGEQLEALYSEELNRRQFHTPLSACEIGCYVSHRRAWQLLLDSGEGALAVFEDDVLVDRDLPAVLDALERKPAGWDVVKLIGRAQEKWLGSHPLSGHRRLATYRRVPSLTGAYVVSSAGAAKLLAARRPFGRPVDVDLRHWWECDVAVRGVQPYPVRSAASSERSTIVDRSASRSLRDRARKLCLQGAYTLKNWHANLTHECGPRVAGMARATGHDVARPSAVAKSSS